MAAKKTWANINRQDEIIAEALHYRDQREKTYRGQALKIVSLDLCALRPRIQRQKAARAHGASQRPQP